ncbi:hypothetical protein SYJ56_04550 [Algoriphagus sp. D3-2-R+10]|uniref:hypothetical protein n=1 Tax=Algoriphagus aurantiacus TaxID=3103948 RepID=UPI002B3DD53E|nr:hypothetical protein [Algoriphagus sp. D3-2-R+10]MEB2774562.1 hypothetical protein [Algoriphagus sp. D3-2-R+10]
MSLLNFMEKKANEKGMAICSNCGTPDIFFSLIEKCTECGNSLKEKPKNKKLQYSLEVLIEFIIQFDEFMPAEPKKIFSQLGKAIIHKIKNTDSIDNTKLIQFQYLCLNIPILGSNTFGGAVDCSKMSIQMVESCPDPLTVGKSLSAVVLALNYIKSFKVANEYIIENAPSVKTPSHPIGNKNVSQSISGCLNSIILFGMTLLIIVAILLL